MVALASSFLHRRKRRAVRPGLASHRRRRAAKLVMEEIRDASGEGFKRHNYGVRETGDGPDGRVDLADQGGEKFFVQCEQWKAFQVDVATVREM